MGDFMFAVRLFGATLLIAYLTQIKISGVSIEARAENFLKRSQVTYYLQDAAAGGASLLQDGYYTTKNFITDSTQSIRSSFNSQDSRASRR